MVAGGLSDAGAKGLISRWVNVESTGGPASENAIGGGHFGIGQWSHSRGSSIWGNTDFDAQLCLALKEIDEDSPGGAAGAGKLLKEAKTPEEGARAASAFERAEHYNAATHIDDWTAKTLKGIDRVDKAISGAGKALGGTPGQGDPHKPGFDPNSVPYLGKHSNLFPPDVHHRLASLMGKPLGHSYVAQNEAHDHRVVNSSVAVNVKGNYPVDKTERPLERPKLATMIRNTTAFAS